MPAYEHRCDTCRRTVTTICGHDDPARDALTDTPCTDTPDCPGTFKRVFSFSAPDMFEPHWNASVGKYVTSKSELKSELARASEAATARTGVEHNFSLIDTHDADPADFGVDDTGLAATHDAKVAAGEIEPSRKFL